MRTASPGAGTALVARAVFAAVALHFVTSAVLKPLVRPYSYSDFATFHTAARNFAAGLDPYDPASLRDTGKSEFGGWIGGYYYPPPFAAVAIRPLAAVPFGTARRLWVLVEAAAYVVALGFLASRLRGDRLLGVTGVAVVGLVYAPFGLDLKLGSVSGLLLLLIALFLAAWHREQRGRAALLLAAAVLLKLAPALVLVYLACRGEWRFALRTVATGALLVAACLPWTGVHAWIEWLTRVFPYLLTANFSWFTNQSLDAFFWRLFVPNPDTTPWLANEALQRAATALAGLALLVVLGRVAWRRRSKPPSGERFDAEIGLVLTIAVLVSRVAWEYLAVLALPAFVVGLGQMWRGEAGRIHAIGLGIAWALCALPFPYAESPVRHGPGILLMAPRTYGMLLLVAISARGLLSHQRVPVAVDEASAIRAG